jgi:hypothetical protein
MKPLTMFVGIGTLALGTAMLAGAAAVHAQSIEVAAPSVIETEGLPRLPNYFRDCWEPLPAYCVRPPGLLWFGDTATLRREHRAFRAHHVRTAVSK